MKYRTLGTSGMSVFAIGLGCMGMSEFYGPADEAQSLATLQRALDLGVNFFDTADIYGPRTNELLLGRALRGHRKNVAIATKFGIVRSADPAARSASNRPEYIRACCEGSLERLGVETIDLYYVHRIDRRVPIEETMGALAELVRAGKIRAIGLSEVSAATLRRAARVHPVAAVQSEYSLWSREPEAEVLPACRDVGAAFVAYSPLGRGMLTGKLGSAQTLSPDDFRRGNPRFAPDAHAKNLELVHVVETVAADHGCTAAQIALAWLLNKHADVIPIPGTRSVARLEENVRSIDIPLADAVVAMLDRIFAPGVVAGERYGPEGMALMDG